MSARDDYPGDDVSTEFIAMLDEIDRHRSQAAAVGKAIHDVNGMNDALSELIRELTAHADAMRELLYHLVDDRPSRKIVTPADMLKAINAYDAFVKEC